MKGKITEKIVPYILVAPAMIGILPTARCRSMV